jgi:hypothetical protein
MLKFFRKIKQWHLNRQISKGVAVLAAIDRHMKAKGYNRQQRKQFWHEFVTRDSSRAELLKRLK